jgi:hypothetical protein
MRFAFHVVAGSRLRGDAPGDRAGEYSARATAGNHAIYHRQWRDFGACGDQRVAAYGRFEGPHFEYVSYLDEFAREYRSGVDAFVVWAVAGTAVGVFLPFGSKPTTSRVRSCRLGVKGAAVLRPYRRLLRCRCSGRRGSGLWRDLWCLSGWRGRRRRPSFRRDGCGSAGGNRSGGCP